MEQIQPSAPPPGNSPLGPPSEGPWSRKRVLVSAGSAAAGGVLAAFLAACGSGAEEGENTAETAPRATAPSDLDIVNFILALEYLESEFYREVIDAGVLEDRQAAHMAEVFGTEESQHVDALKATVEQLGGTPAEPISGDFASVIDAGEQRVLEVAATIENLGAAAYLGQIPRLQSPELTGAALSIHSVEARHAAAMNEAAGFGFAGGGRLEGSLPDGAFGEPIEMEAVLKALDPYVGGASGGKDGSR